MIAEAIKIAPYNYEIYEYLYQNDICNRAEVNVLAEHLGYSLRPVRLSLFFRNLKHLRKNTMAIAGSLPKPLRQEALIPLSKHLILEQIINISMPRKS